jgi:deoxycytidylate deaminase
VAQLTWKVRLFTKSGYRFDSEFFLMYHDNPSPEEQLAVDIVFVTNAKMVSEQSKDPSTKTGALILTLDGVILTGYNSFPLMMRQDDSLYLNKETKYSRMVHCEVRALNSAYCDVRGATLYTWPFISCDRCFVQMLDAGIVRFVAPKPNEDQISRWGPAFDLVRQYAIEAEVELIELDR